MTQTKTARKLDASLVAIFVLIISLTLTTLAIVYATVSVENNLFHTGIVDINLNDGKEIISEYEFIFEPGMTVNKEFFIENNSTWDVYYKIYFEDVSGGLADIIQISILDGDTVLWSGKASELSKANVAAADDSLSIGEKKYLTAQFYFPESAGNEAQDLTLQFTMSADAVQTKNNEYRVFD